MVPNIDENLTEWYNKSDATVVKNLKSASAFSNMSTSAALLTFITGGGADIVLIKEPCIKRHKICGL